MVTDSSSESTQGIAKNHLAHGISSINHSVVGKEADHFCMQLFACLLSSKNGLLWFPTFFHQIFYFKPVWRMERLLKANDPESGPWQHRLAASLASQFLSKWRHIKGLIFRRHCWNTKILNIEQQVVQVAQSKMEAIWLRNSFLKCAQLLYASIFFLMHRIILTSHRVNYVLANTQYISGKDGDRILDCSLVL